MKQSYHLTEKERLNINLLSVNIDKIKQISAKTGRSRQTVSKWCTCWMQNDNLKNKPRAGVKRNLIAKQEAELVKNAQKKSRT